VRRTLVVNADDLGLTVGVNNGIFHAHDRGILTSASLMASAPAAANAIRGVLNRPALGIGVHLTLVDGTPTLPPDRVPTLVGDDGRFRTSWKPFIAACLLGRVSMQDVERELTAQIEWVAFEGINVTHLDAHKHVHVYPPIFEIVVRLASRFRIPVIRVPYEGTVADLPLIRWARQDYRLAASRGIATPQFVGRAMTGVMTADALASAVRRLSPGQTELMVHPGYIDDELRRLPTRLLASREREVELLTSTGIDRLIAAEEILLVPHDLQTNLAPARSYRRVS
jgi:predicted glycoside hydrolase/deacetylase ChbG (UPF0249 family)